MINWSFMSGSWWGSGVGNGCTNGAGAPGAGSLNTTRGEGEMSLARAAQQRAKQQQARRKKARHEGEIAFAGHGSDYKPVFRNNARRNV